MEVNSFETFIKFLATCEESETPLHIKSYGDSREATGIRKGWQRCSETYRKARKLKQNKLRSHLLDFDNENNCLPITEFIKFFSALEDEIKTTMQFGDDLSRSFAVNLHDFMWNKLGDIKTDRRLLFAKED
jgi:hypothetical protein